VAPSAPAAFTPAAPVAATSAEPVARAFVPAAFDSEGFSRIARTLFVRLQAANDSGNLDDLRRFTTPEMFAEIRVDLQERKGQTQSTDVVEVDAQVLDVVQEATQQIVSVRYHGLVRETAGTEPERFDEVWHLVQPQGQEGWLIAGIEQQPLPKA
jgi:predicted lipid-binding transport protein (Tim44 family)